MRTSILAMPSKFFFSIAVALSACFVATGAFASEDNGDIGKAMRQECDRIGNKLGSVSIEECLERKLLDTGARSVNGQAILIKDYPQLPTRKPIARVLVLGGIHGDEYSSVSVVFKWMKMLDKYHSGMFHWHIAPLVNPDGLLQKTSHRLNAHGVDLNRNLPTPHWLEKSREYWGETQKNPRRYPGPAALSEPESQWLYEEIRTFKPHVIVSLHAPYGVIDFDGPSAGPDKLGALDSKRIGDFPGSLGNCAGVQHQIPVITVELPYAGIMPDKAYISHLWKDLVRWVQKHIPNEETLKAYPSFDDVAQKLIASDSQPDS